MLAPEFTGGADDGTVTVCVTVLVLVLVLVLVDTVVLVLGVVVVVVVVVVGLSVDDVVDGVSVVVLGDSVCVTVEVPSMTAGAWDPVVVDDELDVEDVVDVVPAESSPPVSVTMA